MDGSKQKFPTSCFSFIYSVLNLVLSVAKVMSDLSVKEEPKDEPGVGPEEELELEIDSKRGPKVELLKEEPKGEPMEAKAMAGMVSGHIDILHVDTRKGKKAWKRPIKREDAFQATKGYVR